MSYSGPGVWLSAGTGIQKQNRVRGAEQPVPPRKQVRVRVMPSVRAGVRGLFHGGSYDSLNQVSAVSSGLAFDPVGTFFF